MQAVTDWMDQAACKGMDPALFYPGPGESGWDHPARKVCAACPVKTQCLDHALANDERFGFWGGTSEKQRRKMRRGLRELAKCGTDAGYRRHRYRGEPQCAECYKAHAAHNREKAFKRSATVAIGKPDGKYARNRARGWCSRCSAGNHAACFGCACGCGQAETA